MLRNPYYVYGSTDIQVPAKLHFGEFIIKQMYKVRDKVAIINGLTSESITYGQIVQEAMNFAISLTLLGVRKGQSVAICSENRFEYWGVIAGVACTGAAATTINHGYLKEELKHVMNIAKPEYLVISPDCYKLHGNFFKSLPYIKAIILFGNEKLDNVILYNDLVKLNNGSGNVIVNNRLARNVKYEEFEVVDVEGQTDTLFILYSSGTTGLPKGVMLTHLNVVGQCCLPLSQAPEKTGLTIVPWYHIMGLVTTLVAFSRGKETVFLSKFDVHVYLKTIEKYKITQLVLVPPVLVAVAKASGQYDLSCVQLISCGAAPFDKESEQLVKAKFPNSVTVQGYGMTESSLVITRFPYHEIHNAKPGSVGKIIAGTVIKVVDLKTRQPLGPNKPGEICAKGFVIMKGYVGKDRNEDFDDEGFYKTGDVGYYDEDGCFYIVDRLKELIKYKGYQVAPAELEAVLISHESIADAGVVGIPDKRAGELPLAFVVRQPGKALTEKEVQLYVAEKLSNPKHLRGGVRFVDRIPKNPSGKILRKTLREMAKTSTSKL